MEFLSEATCARRQRMEKHSQQPSRQLTPHIGEQGHRLSTQMALLLPYHAIKQQVRQTHSTKPPY